MAKPARQKVLFGVDDVRTDLDVLQTRVEETDARQEALESGEILIELPVDRIDRSPYQARQEISDEAIASLAEDIESQGLNNAITVRPVDGDRYELIAGERRWRAVLKAGHATVLARVRRLTDFQAHLVGVSENNQRAGLSPYEEALEVQALQLHARAAHEPATQTDLARYFKRNLAVINHQLLIARSITPDIVNAAGLTVSDVATLPRESLTRISRERPQDRPRALREAIRLKRMARQRESATDDSSPVGEAGDPPADTASPGQADRESTPAQSSRGPDPWKRYWESGGFQITIRRPIKDLAARKATKYLDDYLPGVIALMERAGDGGVRAYSHTRGEMLFLPPLASLDDAQRRRARAELESRLRMLDDGRGTE